MCQAVQDLEQAAPHLLAWPPAEPLAVAAALAVLVAALAVLAAALAVLVAALAVRACSLHWCRQNHWATAHQAQ
jgi:hypothetical protein